MTVLALLLVWLVLGIAGVIATSRWATRLWVRRKELSFVLAGIALISVTAVGGRPIPRPIGEDRGGVISAVHHSPVKIWAGWRGTA